jgi:hypothetical protein
VKRDGEVGGGTELGVRGGRGCRGKGADRQRAVSEGQAVGVVGIGGGMEEDAWCPVAGVTRY